MSTKTTFEDRLLAELRGEIERREAVPTSVVMAPPALVTPDLAPADLASAVRRRLSTGRRLALAAGVCAVAGLATVLVPGSPADAPAYAVERNDDGSVTLTLEDLAPTLESQRELAERLRPSRVHVDIANLDDDHLCRQPRGEQLPESRPVHPGEGWRITLRPGDTVAFENHRTGDGGKETALAFYAVKGAIKPCVPTAADRDFVELTASPSSVGR
ncbi:hypothetical protein [Streptomyces sp. RG80]|uniref:hypothetical protein n=1 Tax=Streptomyces sp. RG80 TaxID=3157340 RepID=UPI00338EF7AB